jgi:hypothetical protein
MNRLVQQGGLILRVNDIGECQHHYNQTTANFQCTSKEMLPHFSRHF